jgi:drug/metabolite transporter (DMT)-like permease
MTARGLCLPLLFTVFAWGYNFVALKILYAEVSPSAAALMRHVLMYLALVLICRAWYGRRLRAEGESLVWGGWRSAFFGALSMGFYMILFLEALARTSAPEGAILIATAPLFTSLFAILAKQEAFSLEVMLGAALALLGVGMVVFGGAELRMDHLLGNALMLASGIAWALSAVISRPLVSRKPAIVLLTQSMPAAVLVLLPYAFLPTLATPWLELTASTWLAMGHFTILAGALGFAGFFYGVQKIGAPGAMYYQFGVAPVATLFAWMFLGDRLWPLQIAGMGVVLAGVIFATVARNRANARAQPTALDCPAEA